MSTLIATFGAFLAVVLLLVGIALVSGLVLKGSCGGIAGKDCSCRLNGERPGSSCDRDDLALPTR